MAFHIHVPKPLHGWKAFFNEISVIVIGVLIALGLEAVVEELHWRHKVSEGRERLKAELTSNSTAAAELVITAPCIQAQLDQIEKSLLPEGGARVLVPLYRDQYSATAVKMPRRNWPSHTWEAMLQDGTANHLSGDMQLTIDHIYQQVAQMRERRAGADERVPALRLAGYPGTITPEIRANLLEGVWSQSERVNSGRGIAAQIIARVRSIGMIESDAAIDERLEAMAKGNGMNQSTLAYCRSRGLPLADWKAEVAKVRLTAVQ